MQGGGSLSSSQKHRLLGIVVPVFNTEERYLLNCLESLCQDCDDYCVALVDDGSEDHTAKLCSSYAEEHRGFFVYLRQENAGQNAARNTGWRALEAEYTLFVDSDDILAEGSIGVLCSLLKNVAPDVLRFGFKVCADIDDRLMGIDSTKLIDVRRPSKRTLLANQSSLCGVAIATPQLIRQPLVEGFHVGEDLASIIPILAGAESVVDLDETFYGYVQRPTSVIHGKRYAFPLEILKAFELFDNLGISSAWEKEIEWQAIKHLLYWEPLRIIQAEIPWKEERRILVDYMSGRFPNWRSNPYLEREASLFGPSFQLILSGHWKLYRLLHQIKARSAIQQGDRR